MILELTTSYEIDQKIHTQLDCVSADNYLRKLLNPGEYLGDRKADEERVSLLNAWKAFEDTHGSDEDKEKVAKQMPRKVKKRRKLDDDSFEEYMDYVFPADDESSAKMSKLMMAAQKWKQEKEQGAAA